MDFKLVKNSVVLSALLFSVSSFATGSIPLTKGWQIVGANNGYTTSDFNNGCIKFVWAYDKKTAKWIAYSPDSDLQKLIKENGYKTITTIKPNQGFWINSYGNCSLSNGVWEAGKKFTLDMIANKTFYNGYTHLTNQTFDENGSYSYVYKCCNEIYKVDKKLKDGILMIKSSHTYNDGDKNKTNDFYIKRLCIL